MITTRTVRAASSVDQAAKDYFSRRDKIAAQTSARGAVAVARKKILAMKAKATATVTPTARVTSSAATTTALKGQLSRTVTTAAWRAWKGRAAALRSSPVTSPVVDTKPKAVQLAPR